MVSKKRITREKTTPKPYYLRIPSETKNLGVIREFAAGIASQSGFNDEDVDKIELAVDEACANVIKHAYKGTHGEKDIDIIIKMDDEKMTVLITDHGKGFDPAKVQIPDMKKYLLELRRGGLGLYLMKTIMDEVTYDIEPGIKNQVRMVKYLPGHTLHRKVKKVSTKS